jgi:hypothetical protein
MAEGRAVAEKAVLLSDGGENPSHSTTQQPDLHLRHTVDATPLDPPKINQAQTLCALPYYLPPTAPAGAASEELLDPPAASPTPSPT